MAYNIVKYLVIDVEKTLGRKLLLLDLYPYAGYKEGIKGAQEGLVFRCLSETMGYEKSDIKIAGLMQPPFEFDGTPVPVEFEGLEAKVWQDWSNKGMVRLSVTAKGVKMVAAKQIRLGGNRE